MTNEAIIRYACVTIPGMDQEKISVAYLQALDETGLGVRLMPIGMVTAWSPPWNDYPHVFTSALKTRYINVVCVPPGVPLGAPVSPAQFGHGRSTGQEQVAAYEPDSALVGLFTVGIPNVAIIAGESECTDKEVESLKHYNAVVCPTEKGTENMRALGVKNAICIPPDSLMLSRLLSGISQV